MMSVLTKREPQDESEFNAKIQAKERSPTRVRASELTRTAGLLAIQSNICPKGGLTKPNISNFDKGPSKKVRMEENEAQIIKTEDLHSLTNDPKTANNFPNEDTVMQSLLTKMEDESSRNSIAAQLEMMNQLLMLNLVIGLKNQNFNDTIQQFDVPDTLQLNQDRILEKGIKQIESVLQGLLEQNLSENDVDDDSLRVQHYLNLQTQPDLNKAHFSKGAHTLNSRGYEPFISEQSQLEKIQQELIEEVPMKFGTHNLQQFSNNSARSRAIQDLLSNQEQCAHYNPSEYPYSHHGRAAREFTSEGLGGKGVGSSNSTRDPRLAFKGSHNQLNDTENLRQMYQTHHQISGSYCGGMNLIYALKTR